MLVFESQCPNSDTDSFWIHPPSPLALPDDFSNIRRRTYLDCSALQLHSWRLGDELNRVIQISRFKHLNSAQLLLRFRVRTVRHGNLSVLPNHGHRRVRGLKRFLREQMSVLPQFVVVAKTLVKHGVALALGHVFELAGLEIAQTDVFHLVLRQRPCNTSIDAVACRQQHQTSRASWWQMLAAGQPPTIP